MSTNPTIPPPRESHRESHAAPEVTQPGATPTEPQVRGTDRNEADGERVMEALQLIGDRLTALDYARAQTWLMPAVDRENIYALVAPSYCDPEKFVNCGDAFCVEARARADQILTQLGAARDEGRREAVERMARDVEVRIRSGVYLGYHAGPSNLVRDAIDEVAGLNASESGQPPEASDA